MGMIGDFLIFASYSPYITFGTKWQEIIQKLLRNPL